jgi:hypothetical protein
MFLTIDNPFHLESKSGGQVYADLVATLKSRLTVAADKDVQTRKGEQINIGTVANGIAETVRSLLESRRFPESFIDGGANTTPLDLSHTEQLVVECHPMMADATLIIKGDTGNVLLEGQLPRSIAQVIVKALLMGRRKFSHPTEIGAAETALKGLAEWLPKVLNRIAVGCGMSAVGTSYEEDVYNAVLDTLHLDRHVASPEFYGEIRIHWRRAAAYRKRSPL